MNIIVYRRRRQILGNASEAKARRSGLNIVIRDNGLSARALFFDVESDQRSGHHCDAGKSEDTRPAEDTDEKRHYA